MQLKFETCVVFRLPSPPPRPRFPSQNQEGPLLPPHPARWSLCLFAQVAVEKTEPLSRRVWKSEISAMARISRVHFACRFDDLPAENRLTGGSQLSRAERAAKQRAPWVSSTRSFSSPCSCWWAFCTRPTRATRCDRLHNLPPFTASSPFPLTETDPTPPPGTSFRRREGPGVQPHRRGRGMAHILGDLLSLHRH